MIAIGDVVVNILSSVYIRVYYVAEILVHSINPHCYNPATVKVLIKQIYFTTIEVLKLLQVLAVVFGTVIIGVVIEFSRNFGLEQSIGSIIVTFVVDEFAVLFVVLLISLRSGSAVATEIAVMSVNKELHVLERYGIDLITYLYIPRVVSGMISMIILSVLFATTMVLSGSLYTYFFLNMDFSSYLLLVFNALEVRDLAFLLIKSFVYGFVVMAVPIYNGRMATIHTQIPIAVSNGMLKLFIYIFFVEVISLIIQLS